MPTPNDILSWTVVSNLSIHALSKGSEGLGMTSAARCLSNSESLSLVVRNNLIGSEAEPDKSRDFCWASNFVLSDAED